MLWVSDVAKTVFPHQLQLLGTEFNSFNLQPKPLDCGQLLSLYMHLCADHRCMQSFDVKGKLMIFF